ncbi:MAG: hypothetical protein IJL02_07545 [Methanobrevibacter sp.]|uniref:hypothetical protein n=1 Tax=Methanobrevibacter sp. TaxID=66852 RepID=UPI0025DD8FF4|nr:hypothetical protein [Methanobrevibacter sp.]MBQ6099700.1 hypothetical protein [Methanobrevibacter sp.]
MNGTEVFKEDKANYTGYLDHIMDEPITDETLKEIDEMYSYADALSIENFKKHERNLFLLAFMGSALIFIFLLYDEAEWHLLIFTCIPLIIISYFFSDLAMRWDSHRKYLEYRVLAETLRVQFFLLISGNETDVKTIIPWFTKEGVPWILEILPKTPKKITQIKQISDIWIRSQKKYHIGAIEKKEPKEKKNTRIVQITIALSIIAYVATLVFESIMLSNPPRNIDANLVRALLKIALGTFSAIALFGASYYGKMSLSDTIEDHKRMKHLYEEVEAKIAIDGETPEIVKYLAREFLIENSTWYAYQNQNKPGVIF